jgi:hypothetical protein
MTMAEAAASGNPVTTTSAPGGRSSGGAADAVTTATAASTAASNTIAGLPGGRRLLDSYGFADKVAEKAKHMAKTVGNQQGADAMSVDVGAFVRQNSKNSQKDGVNGVNGVNLGVEKRRLQGTAYNFGLKSELGQKVDITGQTADEAATAATHSA